MKTTMVLAVLLAAFMAQAQEKKVSRTVRFEDAKVASVAQMAQIANANNAPATGSRPSRVAMVVTSGELYNNQSLSITAVVHTRIPAGSPIGLQVRRFNQPPYVESVLTWDTDLMPGQTLAVKLPGGGSQFESSKEYALVIFDVLMLESSVDYNSVVSGDGPIIEAAPQIVSNPAGPIIQVNLTDGGAPVDAVVINGVALTPATFRTTFSPVTGKGVVLINLGETCFGGDVRLTVVRRGQSDTTTFRFPSNVVQNCGKG